MSEQDRILAERATVGDGSSTFCNGWYVCDRSGNYGLLKDGTWMYRGHDLWDTEDEARAALEAARNAPPAPAWRDKPTCPGIWVWYLPEFPSLLLGGVELVQEDLEKDPPVIAVSPVYGPIPPREKGDAA